MSTRFLIAALLMTSSAAFAQTAPRTAHQITAVRPAAVLADDIAVTTPLASTVVDDQAALPPTTTVDDPQVVSQPSGAVQAAAVGASVPEPSSIALMAAGLFGAVGLRRRSKK